MADPYGAEVFTDARDLIASDLVDGVVVSCPASAHADLVVAAASAGKAVFVEKPMALTLKDADRAIASATESGSILQVGFNRRFSNDFDAAHAQVASGGVGTPHLLRSLTRDPALADPGSIKPWTIFFETLIHDFDTLNWYNRSAKPVEVYAMADALIAPDFKDKGLLDTAVVTIRYENGAMAVAEASFQAVYGYDVRAEVFGSAGMVAAGDVRASNMRYFGAAGGATETTRLNVDLFAQAYTEELIAFTRSIRSHQQHGPDGADARSALVIALASIASVENNAPVALAEDGSLS